MVAEDRERPARWLALAGGLALAVAFAWRTDASYDTGFHLATGRWILTHHAWPQLDPFTYTVSRHPYITLHGLFQIALALADRAGGDVGVDLLRVLFVVTTFGILWSTCRQRGVHSPNLLLAGFAIAVMTSEVRFSLRPELVSFLCLATTLWMLERYRRRSDPRWLWGVPVVQLLWINGHALAPLGIVVTGLFAVCTWLTPATRPARAPWITLLASVLALFVNPYGVRGVVFALDLATRLRPGNVFARSIVELASPFSHEFAGLRPILAFELLLAGTVLAFAVDRLAPGRGRNVPGPTARRGARHSQPAAARAPAPAHRARTNLFDLTLVLAFAVLSVRSVRNIPLFAIVALPPALDALEGLGARLPSSLALRLRSRVLTALLAAALVGLPVLQILTGAWYLEDHRAEGFGAGPARGMLPTRTLDFISHNDLHGPIFNHLNFGGALIGRLAPRERVFIDGRLEVMGEAFFEQYRQILRGRDWDAMIQRYDPHLALVPNAELPVLRRLGRDPRWSLVAWDGAAALFLQPRSAADSSLAAAAGARRAQLAADRDSILPAAWHDCSFAKRMLMPRHDPGATWGEGNALFGIGDFPAARHEYLRALRESDCDYVPLLLALAGVDEHGHRVDEARRCYRRVLEQDPANTVAQERLEALADTR